MCGIVGAIRTDWKAYARLEDAFRDMLVVDSLRGFDSTGVFSYEYDEECVMFMKEATTGAEFVNTYMRRDGSHFEKSTWMVGHNRAATIGVVNNANAHPYDNPNLIGVHNGTIRGHENAFPKHRRATDSASLYAALSDTSADEKDVVKFFQDLGYKGAYALVWYDKRIESLRFIRNTERPLYLAKTDEGWLFASEKCMLEFAASRNNLTFEIEPFSLNTKTLLTIPTIGEGEATAVDVPSLALYEPPVYNRASGYSRGNQYDWRDDYPFDDVPSGHEPVHVPSVSQVKERVTDDTVIARAVMGEKSLYGFPRHVRDGIMDTVVGLLGKEPDPNGIQYREEVTNAFEDYANRGEPMEAYVVETGDTLDTYPHIALGYLVGKDIWVPFRAWVTPMESDRLKFALESARGNRGIRVDYTYSSIIAYINGDFGASLDVIVPEKGTLTQDMQQGIESHPEWDIATTPTEWASNWA